MPVQVRKRLLALALYWLAWLGLVASGTHVLATGLFAGEPPSLRVLLKAGMAVLLLWWLDKWQLRGLFAPALMRALCMVLLIVGIAAFWQWVAAAGSYHGGVR